MSFKIPKFFQALHYWPAYLLLKTVYRLKIQGRENLSGIERTPVIFASNHRSFFDGPICAVSLPRVFFYPTDFFPVRFLAAREVNYDWRNCAPFPISVLMAAFVRLAGSIPVTRGQGVEANLAEAVQIIKREKSKVWIYPEGKMSKDGIFQKKGKRGVYYLHKMTGAPVVPVGISGNFKLANPLNILKFLIAKRRIIVRFGKPIYDLGEDEKEGVQIVMNEIEKLL